MTETLSEQLCKLCGIKPKYEYEGHYPKTDKNGEILTPIYPDFEKPENFVKLLNKYYSFNGGVDIEYWDDEAERLQREGKFINVIEVFLRNLIYQLENKKNPFSLSIDYENFTNDLASSEWKY